jgi:preprotein translocase subunit SecD
VLAVLLIAMLATVIGNAFAHPGDWHKKFKVGLGLDLSSGTSVTLKAVAPRGGVPTTSQMKTAIAILVSRVNGTGVTGAQVQQQGSQFINISIPGKSAEEVQPLLSAAQLRFRQVLLCTTPIPSAPQCGSSGKPAGPGIPSAGPSIPPVTPSPAPTGTPSAAPTGTPSSSPKASASARPSPTASKHAAGGTGSGQAAAARQLTAAGRGNAAPASSASPKPSSSPSASPSPSPSGSPSPSASASQPAPSLYITGDKTKVDPAALALFGKLNCAGSDKNTNWRKAIYGDASFKWDAPDKQIVACDTAGIKYVLGPAIVLGEWLRSPNAGINSNNNEWVVNFNLNSQGAKSFGTQTSQMYSQYFNTSTGQPTSVLDNFAIVLDGKVVSAPFVQQPITTGQGQISGSFTQKSATNLANVLKYGALPLSFQNQQIQSVSAQLGQTQLNAGLIAAAVGLLLVVLYSLMYYRGLAVVSVFSLAIAALLSWLSVILLSKYQGYTLSLAGVAGLIVAIGITADSFVVYFERLRDEVREGRSLRAAVERGWVRARRTILVSDTVSFLAALLLYIFAISDVRGFAFTLGLTTLIDIVVVFLFTKPMVTLVAKAKFFGQGHRMSGLDPSRLGARAPWRGSRPAAARPAVGGAATATSAKAARVTPKEA